MPADPEDLRELLLKIRYDATAIQAKVTDALTMLARLDVPRPPAPHVCPQPNCGIGKTSEKLLRDHLYLVHGLDEYAPVEELAAALATEVEA